MRIINLDFLRGIAIILVLFRHSNLSDSNFLKHFGWLGVDLFFVLSGFLISNSLFVEYKLKRNINIFLFFVKRILKIFPPFYFFLISTFLIYKYQNELDYNITQYVSEIFFLQSYLPRIWLHTWSLAVEEHFYIIFIIILFFVVRNKLLENKKAMIISIIFILSISLISRIYYSYPNKNKEIFVFYYTHLRSDGILIGVLISYLFCFSNFKSFIINKQWTLFITSLLLILPGFIFNGGSFFMNTVGISMVNVGFGILLIISLLNSALNKTSSFVLNFIKLPISKIGIMSFSIYLWHLNAKEFIFSIFSFESNTMNFLYVTFSMFLGFVMWYFIEKPFDYFKRKISAKFNTI